MRIESNPQESCLGVQIRLALNVFVDLALRIEVGYEVFSIRNFYSIWQSTPNVVLEGGRLGCCISKILALLDLDLHGFSRTASCEWLKEVSDGINGS